MVPAILGVLVILGGLMWMAACASAGWSDAWWFFEWQEFKWVLLVHLLIGGLLIGTGIRGILGRRRALKPTEPDDS
jgi:hypothetical protein